MKEGLLDLTLAARTDQDKMVAIGLDDLPGQIRRLAGIDGLGDLNQSQIALVIQGIKEIRIDLVDLDLAR